MYIMLICQELYIPIILGISGAMKSNSNITFIEHNTRTLQALSYMSKKPAMQMLLC